MSKSSLWDAFISHASEDKKVFVDPLARKLTAMGLTIWYDDFELKVGDSLSGSIDFGLTKSEYGIVILSKKFFEKKWTKMELESLETKATNSDKQTLLPILHNITPNEIMQYSSILSNIKALNSNDGLEFVASELVKKIKGIRVEQYEAQAEPDTSKSSFEEYIFFSKWDLDDQLDKFNLTEGIDIDSNNYVYVADEGNNIRKFDPIGTLLHKWGGNGKNEGEFETAYALAIDSSDNIVVTDSAGRIQKFDSDGRFVTNWGKSGNGEGEFGSPFGIAIDNTGNIFISEESNHRIQKFDSTGKFLLMWGNKGEENGQFNDPIGVAIDSKDNLYVADYLNHRIQVFNNNGSFLRKWGSLGKRVGEFDHPHGITLDNLDMVYVSDSMNNRIQKFTDTGIFITSWGNEGQDDGQLKIPRDLAVDENGVVYVSDGSNNRVQVFLPKNSPAVNTLKKLQAKRKESEEIKQTIFYLDKIKAENIAGADQAWRGLEILARYRSISEFKEVWNAITKEVMQTEPGRFAREALDLLKTMLYSAKKNSESKNKISSKAKDLYGNKLAEILESHDETWQHEKLFAKQILDEIVDDNEKCHLFWKAWKNCAINVKNESAFMRFTGYFINDLEQTSLSFKRNIEPEIFNLIESNNILISDRAKGLHTLLFGR